MRFRERKGERGRERTRGKKTIKEVFDKEEDMKNTQKSFDSLFRTELIFPVGFSFKNSYRDQNCSAMRDFQRRGFLPLL